MNSLIILPQEFVEPSLAVLKDARAVYAREAHDLKAGIRIAAAELGGKRGQALVKEVSAGRVVLETFLIRDPCPANTTSLIVAVPRPQTVKKVLQYAATCGMTAVHFVRTHNVVKSYLDSKGLLPEQVQSEIIKGLEQSGDSIAPDVEVHRFFKPFMAECVPRLFGAGAEKTALALLADRETDFTLASSSGELTDPEQPVLIAVGPESGWTDHEREEFKRAGFRPVSLGPRILRVETAVGFLAAQVELLRAIKRECK